MSWIAILALAVSGATAGPGGVRFVDTAAVGANTGLSWVDAYSDLQNALTDAATAGGAITEIWVAAGVYSPAIPGGDRALTFQLVSSVGVYGGFLGNAHPAGGETSRKQRDSAINITTLTGDLNGDDSTGGSNAENSVHVVDASSVDANAMMDGFIITGGNATTTSGAAVLVVDGSPTFTNCSFAGNHADSSGGAVAILGVSSDTRFVNCSFDNNTTSVGGAVFMTAGNGTFIGCDFTGNSAVVDGGAFRCQHNTIVMTNCTFQNNSCGSNGGAGLMTSFAIVSMTDCTFTSNTAGNDGGALSYAFFVETDLVRCNFQNNTAQTGGASYANAFCILDLVNCMLVNNNATSTTLGGGGLFNTETTTSTMTNCVFRGNTSATDGGAILDHFAAISTLTNCTITNNSAAGNAGGLWNKDTTSATINNCIFWNNTDVGGMDQSAQLSAQQFPPTVNSSIIQGWDASLGGVGNSGDDPLFRDVDGRLLASSPAIDSGNNAALPLDVHDLDGDSNVLESLPLDLDNAQRVIDGDLDLAAQVDLGAFEFVPCPGDINDDRVVGVLDLLDLFAAWGTCPLPPGPCNADINGDLSVGILDLLILFSAWGACP